jgi:Protein of unknown function (DUF3987)
MEEKSWRTKAREVLKEKLVEEQTKEAAGAEESAGKPKPNRGMTKWVPFPLETLPPAISEYVLNYSKAIRCDPTFVLMPLLTCLGGAIGNSRVVRIKNRWNEPPILWSVIVAQSGSQKSGAFDAGVYFTQERQEIAFARYQRDLLEWQQACDLSEGEDGANKPARPANPERFRVIDVNMEGLIPRLDETPRGLTLARDELSGFFKGMDAYRHGKGGDISHYLSMHGARAVTKDRKGGADSSPWIHVARPFLGITGMIPPATLKRVMTEDFFDDGLAARFLMVMPPRTPRVYSEVEADEAIIGRMQKVFDRIWKLQLAQDDLRSRPKLVLIDDDAKVALVSFFDSHAAEQWCLGDTLSSAWSKLEAYVPRIALIIHIASLADAGTLTDVQELSISLGSMTRSIEIVRWFCEETKRVYAYLGHSSARSEKHRFWEWIQEQGGSTTAAKFQKTFWRRFPKRIHAEEALERMVEEGFLRAEEAQKSRGPSFIEYHLAESP